MRLAFRNILHDRLRFVLTITGIAFSAFLTLFQGSLLAGFERAASRIIDSIDTDLWVMHRGVQAFDFAPPLLPGYAGLVRGVPGVSAVHQVAAGLAFWHRPNGSRKTIVIVGSEPDLHSGLPLSQLDTLLPESVFVDASDLGTLGLTDVPVDVEINSQRRRVQGSTNGFASFLGSPYVFAGLREARRSLGLDLDGAMFLLLRVHGRSVSETQADLRRKFPELDVYDKRQFSRNAKWYWITQTGAGGALLTAAVLGFVVGGLIASQSVYATTLENLEEFATLKALGASRSFIVGIVVTQAIVSSTLGSTLGMVLTIPVSATARRAVPWINTPWELAAGVAGATIVVASLASIAAVRAALNVEPGRVFRA